MHPIPATRSPPSQPPTLRVSSRPISAHSSQPPSSSRSSRSSSCSSSSAISPHQWPRAARRSRLDHPLSDLRNVCAHHGRLWGLKMTASQPARPTGRNLAHYALEMTKPDTFYARATMMKALLDPLGYGAAWRDSLLSTLSSCQHVDALTHLNFPRDWQTRPAWA
ncbi:protein of unknown function [Pararobbsia alpina]